MAWIFLYIIPYIFNFTKITSIVSNRIWDSDRFTSEPFNLIILNKLNVKKIEDNIYKLFWIKRPNHVFFKNVSAIRRRVFV